MDPKTKIKMGGLFLIPITLLLLLDMVIFQGGVFVEKVGVFPKRVKPAALEKNIKKVDADLGVKNFLVKTKNADGRFRRGETIEVECSVENISSKVVKNFRSVIRTPQKELAQMQTKTLKPGEKFDLHGSFTPENAGVVIVACRSDSERHIEESNENDNREIATLYIST